MMRAFAPIQHRCHVGSPVRVNVDNGSRPGSFRGFIPVHLAQQTILVVMMVVFSSTLVMAAGLVLALRARAGACGPWAMWWRRAPAWWWPPAPPGSLQLGALGAGLSDRPPDDLSRRARLLRLLTSRCCCAASAGGAGADGADDRACPMAAAAAWRGYGMLAMISFSTIVTMLRSRRGRTSIGGPLVLASHLVLLARRWPR
jgi:hypothetical protein